MYVLFMILVLFYVTGEKNQHGNIIPFCSSYTCVTCTTGRQDKLLWYIFPSFPISLNINEMFIYWSPPFMFGGAQRLFAGGYVHDSRMGCVCVGRCLWVSICGRGAPVIRPRSLDNCPIMYITLGLLFAIGVINKGRAWVSRDFGLNQCMKT